MEICSLPFSFLLSKKQKSGAISKKAETRRAHSELLNVTRWDFFLGPDCPVTRF